ncbi:zinc finger protein 271-like [Eurytemora carolleeae]|uniref:zinc finger protein 271-like n=1 Tax=Eurytemora carolleeae TaxID=1294199 RepID=UPI000C75DF0A|nr:zinc finger protein 271-like [Eurytemora carolleeae]|eukprot:XP_023345480.1 zinc finger protein 271-like [Eurytemora affinis]
MSMYVSHQTLMWVQFDTKEGRTNSIFFLNQPRKRIWDMHPFVFNLCVVSSRCRMDYGSEINLEYVELGGIVGVFVKLDAALIDEHSLENLLHSTQHQIRLIVRACREGSTLHREAYTKANERSRKNKLCHCRYCDDVFYCRADLANHQNRIHPTLPIRSGKRARKPCPTCGRMVLNLALHIRTKHTTDPVNYTSGIAQCRQCDETYSVNTDHASVCRLSPTCPDCKKTFSQWRVMNKHRKIVHQGEKISCQTCNKTYHDTQSLKKHMEAVHLKIKRVCPLCAATVTTLAGHMNAVHADNRNFPCVSCDKKFKSNYDLARHRDSVHLGQKPACPICGKHLANLNQHIRVVHK